MTGKVLFAMAALLAALAAAAYGQQFCDEADFRWSVSGDGGSVTITGYAGSSAEVRIPPRIRGLPVSGIGPGAFAGRQLASVAIPRGVAYIGNSAFFGNRLAAVDIPDTVASIGSNAFANNRLAGIEIPDSVASIGSMAFANNQIAGAIIGDGAAYIGEWAFAFNPLAAICVGGSVRALHANMFTGSLRGLSLIVIGADVSLHGRHEAWAGFRDAYYAGGRVAGAYSYSHGAWELAPGLACAAELRRYDREEDFEWEALGAGAVITGYLGSSAVVRIPSRIQGLPVVGIGERAFQDRGLIGAVIPGTVATIGYSAFFRNRLASVVIGSSVVSIGDWAFAGNRLAGVDIPPGVADIGNHAFRDNRLASVAIPDSVAYMGSWAFSGNLLGSAAIGSGLAAIEHAAFYGNRLAGIAIPDNVAFIGWAAFAGNDLASVTIGNDVEIEGGGGFPSRFAQFYRARERRAGTYTLSAGEWSFRAR